MMGSSRHCLPEFADCLQSTASDSIWSLHLNEPPSSLQADEHPSPEAVLPSSHSSPVSTLPLPQVMSQARVVVVPLPSRHFGSLVQVFEQPLPSPKNRPFWSPASQDSPGATMPLPHTAGLHLLGVDLSQLAPGSMRQVLEQPSPLSVLPSSQDSVPVRMPSPQSGVHRLPGTRQIQPFSTIWQSAEQPSPPLVLPSSQLSLSVRLPSPQRGGSPFCPGVRQVSP